MKCHYCVIGADTTNLVGAYPTERIAGRAVVETGELRRSQESSQLSGQVTARSSPSSRAALVANSLASMPGPRPRRLMASAKSR